MGAPELPNDPGDEDLRPTEIVQHPVASDSEDSMDDYNNGYQQLPMEENGQIDNRNIYDEEDNETEVPHEEAENVEVTHGDPNFPAIEPVDVEIEREIWNQPRSEELPQIELDSNKTQTILNAMANFNLNISVPEWASNVSEESWKEILLQRIRQRKPLDQANKMDVDSEST